MYDVPYQVKLPHEVAVVSPFDVVVFCVIATLADAVQPFAPVAVTVYVPAAVTPTFTDEPKLLFQEYESPPVAVKLMAVIEQFNNAEPVLLVIPTFGPAIFCVTVTPDVAVHPLAAVTVTVYVPGEVMLADADDPKLLLHK